MSSLVKTPENIGYWQTLKTILPAVYRSTPLFTILDCTSMAISSSWYVLTTFLMRNLFDTIEQAVRGQAAFQTVITFVLLAFGAQVMGQVLNLACFAASQPLKIRVKGALDYKIHAKAARLRAINFEHTDT